MHHIAHHFAQVEIAVQTATRHIAHHVAHLEIAVQIATHHIAHHVARFEKALASLCIVLHTGECAIFCIELYLSDHFERKGNARKSKRTHAVSRPRHLGRLSVFSTRVQSTAHERGPGLASRLGHRKNAKINDADTFRQATYVEAQA